MAEYYRVVSPNKALTFGVTVHHAVDGTRRQTVWLGAKKNRCVVITVYFANDGEDDVDVGLAHVEGVSHDPKCAVGNKMPTNTGTFQMAMTAFLFVLHQYPHVYGFTLKDTSTLECDDGGNVDLAYLQASMYGKTWYQRRFNAVPYDEADTLKMANWNWLRDPLRDSYDAFYDRWIANRADNSVRRGLKEALRPFYAAASSPSAFIANASRALGCQVTRSWVRRMLIDSSGLVIEDITWIVRADALPSVPPLASPDRLDAPLFPSETDDVKRRRQMDKLFAIGGGRRQWPFGRGAVRVTETM